MRINKNNYESYFVDYLEGNLDEKLVDDFIEFLQKNPELKKELSLFDSVSIVPEDLQFSKKERLYKEKYDREEEFNQAAINRLEGDISEKENKNFNAYLSKHPEKEKEIKLFDHTKLKADESILFTKKQRLYRHSKGKTILMWTTRIAAVLVLAFMIYTLTDQSSNNLVQDNQIAQVEKKNTKKATNPVVEEKEITETPEKQEIKKEEQVKSTTPAVKKIAPKPQKIKSLRETTKGRMESEDLALHRIPVEVPAEMKGITASFNIDASVPTLATMNMYYIEEPEYEERLFADVVKEKTGIDKLSFNTIKKAGLNLVSNITKDNLSYETNKEGKITEINFDSRLLAFSIPTHSEEAGE